MTIGAGHTLYFANEDGSISRSTWNDPSWSNRIIEKADLMSPHIVANLLQEAYKAGYEERGIVIRNAIGQPGRLG